MGSSASTADTSKPVVVNKPIGDKPRFSYFPVHGKGLPVLLLMELHGMQYDGNVVGMEAWGEVKGSGMCPFGQLPILETADCGTVAQQQAILRYIEAKTESESKDLKEQVRVSMALNLSEELCQAFATVQPNQLQKDKPAEPCKKFWEEKLPEYLAKVEKFLDGKTGFAESGKSSADVHMYATLHQMRCLQPDLLDKTPAVKSFYERVDALEPVQKVLTGQSAFGGFIQMFLSLAEAQPEAKDAATAAPAAAATEAAPAADTKTNLYIFPFRPAAAPVLAMEVHGMPYRVQRVNFDKWPELKGSGVPPFGQLPTLETEEGITIGQSAAVMQYIGEKTKSKGKDLREETVSRMLLACVPDLMNMMRAGQPWMQQMEKTQEENDKLWNEQLPTQFANFEKLLDGKDRFTESGTTVGELALFVILGNILPLRDAVLEKAPNLQKFCDRISGLDATKKLREGKSPAGELAPVFFKFGEKPAEEKKEEATPEEKKEAPKAEGEAEKKEEPKAEGEAEKKEAPKEEKKDDKPAEEKKEEAPKPAE